MSFEIADVITPGNDKAFTVGDRKNASSIGDLPETYRRLLESGVTAAMATINADNLPQLTPVWVNHDGTHLNLNSVRGRLKDRNLRARPDVSLMLVNPENPYHWITVYGRVEEIIDEDDPAKGKQATDNIDDLAEIYVNQRPYPFRDPKGETRVLYKVRPTRILTFGG